MFWVGLYLFSYFFTFTAAGSYVPIDVDIPPNVKKIFTAEEIAQYDGNDVSIPNTLWAWLLPMWRTASVVS